MGEQGFWLRGGSRAEVFLRALEPVKRMTFHLTGGPLGDRISLSVGGSEARLELPPLARREIVLEPGGPFVYKDSFVYVLRLASTRGGAAPDASGGQRNLAAFAHIGLEVEERVRPSGAMFLLQQGVQSPPDPKTALRR
jgi:hypothetical protein